MADYATFQRKWDKAVGEDEAREFGRWKSCSEMSQWLQRRRILSGLTEKDVAGVLGWTKEDVFVFEMKKTQDINFGDLVDYLEVLDLGLEFRIRAKDTSPQKHLEYYNSKIFDLLKNLVEKAGDDEKITEATLKFIYDYNHTVIKTSASFAAMFQNRDVAIETLQELFPEAVNASHVEEESSVEFSDFNKPMIVG